MEHFKLLSLFLSIIIAIDANDNVQSYCGTYLIKELKNVCQSHYYGRGRRSYMFDNYPDDTVGDYTNESYDYNELADLIFDNDLSTPALLTGNYFKRHLKVRDIVNECCRKPCSRTTLSLYCNTTPR